MTNWILRKQLELAAQFLDRKDCHTLGESVRKAIAALTVSRESGPTFNEAERRVLLDLIDEENARDRRTHVAGRTTREVWDAQDAMYWGLRRKLVAISPTEDSVPG